MHLQLDLVQTSSDKLPKPFVTKVIQETLLRADYPMLCAEDSSVSISVAFVPSEEIQRLNALYRKKNKVTDVLSFPEYPNRQAFLNQSSKEFFLGELVLCYDYIKQASIEDEVSLEQEMAYIISHGVLHLLGFRHSPKMFALQDTVSEKYTS